MAETQHSIRLIKTFTYRGDPIKAFSNRYHFDGAAPGSSTAWHDFMDAVVLIEKTVFTANVTITEAIGMAPGSTVPIASKQYSTLGSLVPTGGGRTPGDAAVVLRMATTKRSVKNHPVYCFSYFHDALIDTGQGGDVLLASQKAAVENYGNDWLNGITVSGRTYKRTTPDGFPTTGRFVEPWVGHRDFVN